MVEPERQVARLFEVAKWIASRRDDPDAFDTLMLLKSIELAELFIELHLYIVAQKGLPRQWHLPLRPPRFHREVGEEQNKIIEDYVFRRNFLGEI